jgi:hypothetical protein
MARRELVEILKIVRGFRDGSLRQLRYVRNVELELYERDLRGAAPSSGAMPEALSAPDEADAQLAAAVRLGARPAVDEELTRWFGRDLDADSRLTLLAAPTLYKVIEHDALAGEAARQMLKGLKRAGRHRRILLGPGKPGRNRQVPIHIVGDQRATPRLRGRALRDFYTGPSRWPTAGRFFDLALADYVEAQRIFRRRLRLVSAHTDAHPADQSTLADRFLVVRDYLRRLHPSATSAHAVRVLERTGNEMGSGSLRSKVGRLETALSRQRADARGGGGSPNRNAPSTTSKRGRSDLTPLRKSVTRRKKPLARRRARRRTRKVR